MSEEQDALSSARRHQELAEWYLSKAQRARRNGDLMLAAEYLDTADAHLLSMANLETNYGRGWGAAAKIEPVEDTGQHEALTLAALSPAVKQVLVRSLTADEALWVEATPGEPLSAFPGPPRRP